MQVLCSHVNPFESFCHWKGEPFEEELLLFFLPCTPPHPTPPLHSHPPTLLCFLLPLCFCSSSKKYIQILHRIWRYFLFVAGLYNKFKITLLVYWGYEKFYLSFLNRTYCIFDDFTNNIITNLGCCLLYRKTCVIFCICICIL
jgi:hypothetical protein